MAKAEKILTLEEATTFGSRVMWARQQAGFKKPEDMASAMASAYGKGKITQQGVSKIERDGAATSWTTPYLAALCGVSALWLASGIGEPHGAEEALLTSKEEDISQMADSRLPGDQLDRLNAKGLIALMEKVLTRLNKVVD